MKTKKNNMKRRLLMALVSTGMWLTASSGAWATAMFSAETGVSLTLSQNTNLSVSVVDTFFDVFEAGIGDASTTVVTQAVPMVDFFVDPPVALQVGETLDLSVQLSGSATSTPAQPFSLASASVLGTAMVRIENPGDGDGEFGFDLGWSWQSLLSIEHAGELAGIDLELVVGFYDDQWNALSDPLNVFFVSLDTALGDTGSSGNAGSLGFGSVVGPGQAWNLVIDLFAMDGRAQSELPQATVPVTAPLVLLMAGLAGLAMRRRQRT